MLLWSANLDILSGTCSSSYHSNRQQAESTILGKFCVIHRGRFEMAAMLTVELMQCNSLAWLWEHHKDCFVICDFLRHLCSPRSWGLVFKILLGCVWQSQNVITSHRQSSNVKYSFGFTISDYDGRSMQILMTIYFGPDQFIFFGWET